MPKKSKTPGKTSSRVSESKVSMNYRLSPAKIARARKVLGTSTATATIEEALDLVVFRAELTDGIGRAFGMSIDEAFPDGHKRRR